MFTKIGKAVFGHADALKPGDQISFPGHVPRLDSRLFGAVLVAAAIGYGCAGPTSKGVHILIELDGREGASHDDPREKRSAKDASARLPPFGVYAVAVDRLTDLGAGTGAQRAVALAGGVANIGVRPTVKEGAPPSIEVHLFDLDADLYGAVLRVHLLARLRGEQKFSGLDALRAQIAKDAAAARVVLGETPPPPAGAPYW